ncbi:MAG: amino acid adenylation domain-containing protein [Planctomycetota bacterium]
MADRSSNLFDGFSSSAERFPDRPALEVGGEVYAYSRLRRLVHAMASSIADSCPSLNPPRVAILAERSPIAYQGILAALSLGYSYVPLSPQFPPRRLQTMLERSRCQVVVADAGIEALLVDVLDAIETPLTVIGAPGVNEKDLAERLPRHRFLSARQETAADEPLEFPESRPVSEKDMAYLMFTSGSTGVPKGVMVTHGNVAHFLDFVGARYGLSHEDRFSQMFDLVFDLSVFDLFAAWRVGGCVCVPARSELLTPARFITESRLTVWFSVPSVAGLMSRLRLLESGTLPGLRLSLFCGEALTAEVTRAWSEAAPHSIVENLYGPTELTLSCTYYRWDGEPSRTLSHRGVVPIGFPFPDCDVLVVDDALRPVPDGEPGELLMAGPQVALGYLDEPEKTANAFVVPPGRKETYYRTGDRVFRQSPDGPLHFLGRMDHQLKVRGNRLELGEVEAALRKVTGTDAVAAVGWPITEAGADGIVAFVLADAVDVARLRAELGKILPPFAIPREIRAVEFLPLNPNGKLDRAVLKEWCNTRASPKISALR